jgi:hypothetical protein
MLGKVFGEERKVGEDTNLGRGGKIGGGKRLVGTPTLDAHVLRFGKRLASPPTNN